MNRYWFRPHRYGLGATPKTWEGWAFSAAYIVSLLVGAYLTGASVLANTGQPLSFIAYTVVATTIFLVICWRTTEGGWRWRWGDKD